MTAYRYFFNIFNGEYFEKQVLLTHMNDDIARFVGRDASFNNTTLQKDIDTFLNTYTQKHNLKIASEEQFNSPLAEINLIKDNGKGYFLSDLNDKKDLPIEIFVYSLIRFVNQQAKYSKSNKVNFNSLLDAPYSPGRIFRLSEQGLGVKLDEAQSFSSNKVTWIDSQGLRQITVEKSYLKQEKAVLDGYFEGCLNE